MNMTQDDKQASQAILEVGTRIQVLSVIVGFAIKSQKREFLEELNALVEKFTTELTQEEISELKQDVEEMFKLKGEELAVALGENMEPEEVKRTLEELKPKND